MSDTHTAGDKALRKTASNGATKKRRQIWPQPLA